MIGAKSAGEDQVHGHSLVSLTETELLEETQKAVQHERHWTQTVIEHLAECDRRGIHLRRGYASLHEFAVRFLMMSDGAAHRRIQAMRLTRAVPEASELLRDGKLMLSHAAKLQNYFSAEARAGTPLEKETKRHWIENSKGLSSRELERKILENASIPAQSQLSERAREITPHLTELRLIVSEEFRMKLERLKELASHRFPSGSTTEILESLLTDAVAKLEKQKFGNDLGPKADPSTPPDEGTPAAPAAIQRLRPPSGAQGLVPADGLPALPEMSVPPVLRAAQDGGVTRPIVPPVRTGAVPAETRRRVWRRAQGQCEFQVRDAAGRLQRCSARRTLEIDHRRPRALGGDHSLENLRLLCRAHNSVRVPAFRARVPGGAGAAGMASASLC